MLLDEKASQNSPPAKAANDLNRFSPQHVCGENTMRGESVFSPVYGRKSAGRSESCLAKKVNFFAKFKQPRRICGGAALCDRGAYTEPPRVT